MPRARRYGNDYKTPGRDSPRAIAQATQLLVGARSIDHFTVEWLAHQCNLSLKVAEYHLTIAKQRRANG